MKPARNPEVSKLQSSKPHESHSDPDSDLTWSEYKRSLRAAETNFDIANTHKSNQELKQCDAVQNFFAQAATVRSLEEYDTRNWIGSLPSTMSEWAVPLFTDENEIDFQLHFSYTWMGALHTARTKNANIVDPYVHGLVHIINSDESELIDDPIIVIPLGKLFINKSRHSTWTGYEIFVTSELSLWIIYVLDEVDPEELYPDEVRLSRWDIPGSIKKGQDQTEEPPGIKIARLWGFLGTIEFATFEEAQKEVQKSSTGNYTGPIHLLELSRTVASKYIQMKASAYHDVFATSKFEVHTASSVGKELLLLAIENSKVPIMRLKFGKELEHQNHGRFRDLLSVAIKHADETIIELLLVKGKVDVDMEDENHSTPLLCATVNAVKRAAKIATSYAAEKMPSIDYSKVDDKFDKFINAISHNHRLHRTFDEEYSTDDVFAAAAKLAVATAQDVCTDVGLGRVFWPVTLSAIASAAVFVTALVIAHYTDIIATKDTINYKNAVSRSARYATHIAAGLVSENSKREDFIDEYSDIILEKVGRIAGELVPLAVHGTLAMSFGPEDAKLGIVDFALSAGETQPGISAAQYTKDYAAKYIATYEEDRILKLLKEYKQNYKRITEIRED